MVTTWMSESPTDSNFTPLNLIACDQILRQNLQIHTACQCDPYIFDVLTTAIEIDDPSLVYDGLMASARDEISSVVEVARTTTSTIQVRMKS